MSQLHRSGPSVVKSRTGSVLSRGFILKTDHYPSGECATIVLSSVNHEPYGPSEGRALDLELNVHGAPNFRSPRLGSLNVYGVAQPRTQGLRAILSLLRCRPNVPSPTRVVWFCTREEPIGTCSCLPTIWVALYQSCEVLNELGLLTSRWLCGNPQSTSLVAHSSCEIQQSREEL